MQAIITRYLGPTDHRGSRIKATAQAGSVTLEWDDRLNVEVNHDRAALALANKFGWIRDGWDLESGGLPDGSGNVYVLTRGAALASAVLTWARMPEEHGGNPYSMPMVKLAEKISPDVH